ncbi:MAG: response regulator transcription factor [Nocardioides sp.]
MKRPDARMTYVSVVSPQPVVEHGIASLLTGHHGGRSITTRSGNGEPDVVFYDVVHLQDGDGADLEHWLRDTDCLVIAVTQELRPDLGALALQRGAHAAISLGGSESDYREVLESALTGRLHQSPVARDAEEGTRAGGRVDLTRREADVLALIVRGASNTEIAAELSLSINSVKSYIRSAYRKMDVASRARAVKWGVQHGFALDAERSAGPTATEVLGALRVPTTRSPGTRMGSGDRDS